MWKKEKWYAFLATLLVILILVPSAFASVKPSFTTAVKYSSPDNPQLEPGVGLEFGVWFDVEQVAQDIGVGRSADDFTVGLVMGRVGYELLSPFGTMEIGDLEQTTFDGMVRYMGLPNWGAVQPYAYAGLGVAFNDLDSTITGLDLEADKSLRVPIGIGWDWVFHSPDTDDKTAYFAAAFGEIQYVHSNLDATVGPVKVNDQDTDTLDVKGGIKLGVKF